LKKSWIRYFISFLTGVTLTAVLSSAYIDKIIVDHSKQLLELTSSKLDYYKLLYSVDTKPWIERSNAYSLALASDDVFEDKRLDVANLLLDISVFLNYATNQKLETRRDTFNSMIALYARTHAISTPERNESFMKSLTYFCKEKAHYQDCKKSTVQNLINSLIEKGKLEGSQIALSE